MGSGALHAVWPLTRRRQFSKPTLTAANSFESEEISMCEHYSETGKQSFSYSSYIIGLLWVSDMRKCSVGELIKQTHTSRSFVHEVIKCEPRTHTLGSVKLVLAMGVFFTQFSGASCEGDEAEQALVCLILQPLETRIIRVWMVCGELVHVTH